MPTVTREGVTLYYELDGDGDPVAFVTEAGLGAWSWGWQHRAIAGPYRTLVYDHRGTGRSDTPPGPYAVADLVADLRAIVADAGLGRPHLVGIGLGGMVAATYALEHGARTLTLAGTAASGERIDTSALVATEVTDLLSAEFRESNPDALDTIREWRERDDADRDGREPQVAAAKRFEADALYELTVPTLVVHGDDDRVVPVEAGRDLADRLPRGEFHAFDGAGHLVTVERSRPVNDLLFGHFSGE